MRATKIISEFVRQAREVLFPSAPHLMTTWIFECKGQSDPVGYSREPDELSGARRLERHVPLRVPVTGYRYAEARRVRTKEGCRYKIDYVTVRTLDTQIRTPFVRDGKALLFTLKDAVNELHHAEDIFRGIRQDYLGIMVNAEVASRRYQRPNIHFSLWEEPTKPLNQSQPKKPPRIES